MATATRIFDLTAARLRRRQLRITGGTAGASRPNFLFDLVGNDMIERLQMIRREFRSVLIIGDADVGRNDTFVSQLSPNADWTRLDPVELGEVEFLSNLASRPESFNLALCPLGLQCVSDLPGALTLIRRSLVPDGLLLAAVIGGQSFTELRQSMLAGEMLTTAGAAPRVHPMIDVRDMGRLLLRAGFALPVADQDTLHVTYRDLLALCRDLRALGLGNILSDRSRIPLRRDTLIAAAEHYSANFAAPDGRLKATMEIVTAMGWAPHESQQQPLKPRGIRR